MSGPETWKKELLQWIQCILLDQQIRIVFKIMITSLIYLTFYFTLSAFFKKVALKSCLAPRWSETNRSVNEAFIKSQRPLRRESPFFFAQAFFPTVGGQTDSGPTKLTLYNDIHWWPLESPWECKDQRYLEPLIFLLCWCSDSIKTF